MGEPLKLRAFLALPLAPSFKEEVAPLLAELKKKHPEIRWVSAAEIHVTLHFFGSIEAAEVSKISSLIEPFTKAVRPFDLCLEGLGAFPSSARPRVIWIGVCGETTPFVELRNRIEGRLKENGYPCEEREFRPHATIGRMKQEKRGEEIQPVKFGPTATKSVKELVLFKSHLTPQGAHYEAIQTYPLAAA